MEDDVNEILRKIKKEKLKLQKINNSKLEE
jgi:hypothetical protein